MIELSRPIVIFRDFDPNQPRDEQGRWTDTGADSGGSTYEAHLLKGFPPIRLDVPVEKEIAWTEKLAEVPERELYQQAQIERYVGSEHENVNAQLRDGFTPDQDCQPDDYDCEDLQGFVVAMDDAIRNSEMEQDAVLYRGVSSDLDFSWMKPGLYFQDEAFQSWSASRKAMTDFAKGQGTVFRTLVRKGDEALWTGGSWAGFEDEHEFVLPRGTEYRVVAVEENVPLYQWEMIGKGSGEVPPFKAARLVTLEKM